MCRYLLSMDKLWTKRKPPTPLDWDCLSITAEAQAGAAADSGLEDQKVVAGFPKGATIMSHYRCGAWPSAPTRWTRRS